MGLDFRRFAAEIPASEPDDTEPAEQPDENDVQEDAGDAPEQPQNPTSCSYCGATDFGGPPEDNGRIMRAECQDCHGTMVSHDGIGWQPDLIGSPHNHPRGDADPASGGVSGVGNIPQRTTEQQLHTAMPGKHTPPADLQIERHQFEPGDDEHDDLDSEHPGWDHYRLRAVLPGEGRVGHLEYSADPHLDSSRPGLAINNMHVNTGQRSQGIASAMQDHLRVLHPEHVIDHGGRSPEGEKWWGQYHDPAPHLDWDHHQNNPWKVGSMDPELRLHMTAAWADVRAKAMRIRAAGGVLIKVASADGVGGEVRGDHGTYETVLTYLPGSRKVGTWHCGCAWGTYAWDRSPAFMRYQGRLCSHGLAMQLEAQSHDRPVTESHPSWMRRHRTRHVVESAVAEEVYPDGHGLDLVHPPVYGFVLDALARGADPAQGMGIMLTAGIEHARAKALLREALTESPTKDDTPTHAGLVLKAADTGRVLMLQRSMEDEKNPAAGRWEWPGGGLEDGDHNSLHGAFREFTEEVGHPVPKGGTLQHVWHSGPYVGHVMVVPSESDLPLHKERTVDNPDGDHHEQSAWWDPQHARKNPALREECKSSPWDEIQGADRGKTATYSVNDPMGSPLEDPPALSTPPQQVQSENPGSTGFATGADPSSFNDATQRSMSIPDMASYAHLHDEPEGALPSTDGADDDTLFDDPGAMVRSEMSGSISDTESVNPTTLHAAALAPSAAVGDIVAQFQATAGAKALGTAAGPSDGDIASAAREHLTKAAVKTFSPFEQQELITEGVREKVRARNSDRLLLAGSHYESLQAALDAQGDPDDCLII